MKDSDAIRVSSEMMRAAVTQYARNYIRERWQNGKGVPFAAIADELGVSSAYVQQINNTDAHPKLRVGVELEYALAHRVHGGSIDALRKAALHIYGGGKYVAEIDGQRIELGQRPPSSAPPELSGATAASAGSDSRRRVKRARRLER